MPTPSLFPRSTRDTVTEGTGNTYFGEIEMALRKVNLITKERIMWAINQFDSNKGSGLDGIKPILLKNLLDKALERLWLLHLLFACRLCAGT